MPAAEEVGNPVTDVTFIPQRKAPSSQSPTQHREVSGPRVLDESHKQSGEDVGVSFPF